MDVVEDLLLWFDFNQGRGSIEPDHSEWNHHGTLYGAIREAGHGCNVMKFDGTDDYIEVPHDSVLTLISGPATIAFWAKCGPDDMTYHIPLCKGCWNVSGWYIQWLADTIGPVLWMDMRDAAGEKYIRSNPHTPSFWRAWHHIVFVRETAKVYLDSEDDTLIGSVPGDLLPNTYPLFLGKYYDMSSIYFYQGWLDDVRIYNRTLSLEEITYLYNLGRTFV